MSIRTSLEELVTACGGTPTKTSIKGLLGEATVALGGEGDGKTIAEQISKLAAAMPSPSSSTGD